MTAESAEMQALMERVAALQAENAAFRASASQGDAFIQHLRTQTAYQRDAWKAELDASKEYFGEVHAKFAENEEEAWNEVKASFVEQARSKLLGPLDVLLLTYLIFGSRNSHFKLASAWLDAPTPADKVKAHNWLLAGSLPESRLRLIGPAISNLRWPLFPENVGNEFALLNREVLREAGATAAQQMFGRGVVEETRPTIFGETGVEEHLGGGKPQRERVVYGAGGYSVKVSADGFVDLSAADAAMREAQNRISALEAALRSAGLEIPSSSRGRGGGYRGRGARGGYQRGGEGDRHPN